MGRKRYRVGIDVGLYSVGLSAIEIDDSFDNPFDAYPISLLSTMSVIHDGGLDPDSQKTADSRKAISGVARRTRRLNKNKRKRLQKLDETLHSLNYPVAQAAEAVSGLKESSPYLPWQARIAAAESYIDNDFERRLAICISLRHIARHRGWRNPYSNVSSLENAAAEASKFYLEFFERIERWKSEHGVPLEEGVSFEPKPDSVEEAIMSFPSWSYEGHGASRPTPAQLIKPLLSPMPTHRIRANRGIDEYDGKPIDLSIAGASAQMGKLHQSDNYFEMQKIFEKQNVSAEDQKKLFEAVFFQINPKDVGAAAQLVAKDDLQPKRKRASKASLAFQKYRILTTLSNLRIAEKGVQPRSLSSEEIQSLFDYLCSKEVALQGGVSWHEVAENLGIERNCLKGVGGTTADGEPISAQTPPYLSTEFTIQKAEGIKKELAPLNEWWSKANELEKEWLVEFLGNAGMSQLLIVASDEEKAAYESTMRFIEELGALEESALMKLDKIKLPSGRAAYSIDTLNRLNRRMLNDSCDLFVARKEEFGVENDWSPCPEPLGTPTGNPAVDRTIKQVSRWLKACERSWGRPETINLEHVRDGFVSPKKARELKFEMDKRYKANSLVREEIIKALGEDSGSGITGMAALRNSDVRRHQAIQRQNCQCLYCGKKIDFLTAQMDHIVPRKGVGSNNVLSNLVATCASCNTNKSNTLFYKWATADQQKEAIERVDSWIRDSYFSNEKDFGKYKKDVKMRLKQTEEDDPIDNRSIESVAWMARELKEQIRGHFGYEKAVAGHTSGNEDYLLQRVNVFRGWLTSEARKASGLEKALPWIGGATTKERLDRRHHAIDASVIALMRPAVAKTLVEREEIKRRQRSSGITEKQIEEHGAIFWKDYCGRGSDTETFLRWRDEQMQKLVQLLIQAMNDDRIIVTNPIRLRLGYGRAHEDKIRPLVMKKVGDALVPTAIDKAETPALWLALTSHPDYDSQDGGLPEDNNRRIRIHDRWLDASDKIGFMAEKEAELSQPRDAVCVRVRGGFAKVGSAMHHVRFYRIPKLNSKGEQVGWSYAQMRVYQHDLLGAREKDLFSIEIPPQAISFRSAIQKLREALSEGTAIYLGWAVVGDEILIDPDNPYFAPEKTQAINVFMRAFPGTRRFQICGFDSNSKVSLRPIGLAAEGIPDLDFEEADGEDINKKKQGLIARVYSDATLEEEDIKKINSVIGRGKIWRPATDSLLATSPTVVRRNTLGVIRWSSDNHMPVSWKVPPRPEF